MPSSVKVLLTHPFFLKDSFLENEISDKIPNEMIASVSDRNEMP